MKQKHLVVFGAGGHGKMVIEAALGQWEDISVCDDGPGLVGAKVGSAEVKGGVEWLKTLSKHSTEVIVAIGNNAVRARVLEQLASIDFPIVSVVHPRAIVSPSASLKAGVFVGAGSVVGADVALGRGVIVNTGATVDHDCVLEECVHIGPGAHLCGGVRVGGLSLISVGASIAPGISIGRDCTIGAGGAVVTDIADGVTAVGVPAHPMRR